MIASVRGMVLAVRLDAAVVEVGGVGLLVQAAPATLAGLRTGGEADLSTSLVVREESLTLFGFADVDERDVFETLQTVSGIGPRLALAMLAVHTPDGLRSAVASADIKALTKVPGIGTKGAQRILLELTDRLGPPRADQVSGGAGSVTAPAGPPWRGQVVDALVGLGWPVRQASDAVESVAADLSGGPSSPAPDVALLLRSALRLLGRTT